MGIGWVSSCVCSLALSPHCIERKGLVTYDDLRCFVLAIGGAKGRAACALDRGDNMAASTACNSSTLFWSWEDVKNMDCYNLMGDS